MAFFQIIVLYLITGIEVSTGTSPLGEKISLSPATWTQEEYLRLETISLRKNPRPKPLAYSDVKGLVAGTTSALAVHAGADALKKGGNAMDACIATAMAEIPLTAGARVSFAGVANFLYYDHVTGRVHNLDAGWKIPRNRNQEQIPSLETLGDSVLVPGLLAGMFEAAEFSKFSLSTLLEPALFFAEKGFKVPHSLSRLIKKYYNKHTLLKTDKGLKIFTNPETNKPYEPTELFRQPQLAKFIRNIQKHGKNYFYRGKWTKKMLGTVKAHGGYMNSNDMADCEAQWIEPASTMYNGYQVITTGADWGGVELIEMLKIMNLAGMTQTNGTYLTNATKLLTLISTSRYSQFISAYSHANPEAWGILHEYFHIDASRKGRMSNSSAKLIWNHLSSQEGVDMINELITELLTSFPDVDRHRENRRGSSGIVAMDKEGNICSMAHTANARPWGTGLFVQGVALPHSGAVLRDMVSHGQPGSRVPSGLQPVIVFKKNADKKPSSSNESLPSKGGLRDREKRWEVFKHKDLEPTKKSTEKHTKNADFFTKNTKKQHWKSENYIRGQHNEEEDHRMYRSTANPNPTPRHETKIEGNASIGTHRTENQEQTGTEEEVNGNEPKNEFKNEWEREWENHWENELEEDKNENEWEYDKWGENEWENEWENEIESEKEELGNENGKEFPRAQDHEEPETIGGLFDINELNSNGKENMNKTAVEDSSSQYAVKSWFRNLIQKLLGKKNKLPSDQNTRKNYKKKRRNRQLKPVAALSVIGPSSTEAILQYINNLLDNGMDAKQASDTPMFYSSTPGFFRKDVRLERFSFDHNVINDVRSRGQNVSEVMYKVGRAIAGFGAVLTARNNKIYGCSHPESEGFAEGH